MRCGAELGGESGSASPCFELWMRGRGYWAMLDARGAASWRSRERRRLKLAFLLARHVVCIPTTPRVVRHASCWMSWLVLCAGFCLCGMRTANRQSLPPTATTKPRTNKHVKLPTSSHRTLPGTNTRAHSFCKAQNYCIRLPDHARRWTGECGRAREPAAAARVGSAA